MKSDLVAGRIEITFEPGSAEARIHIEGVNEIQLFGAAKMIEQTGIEHMARRAMEGMMQQAANGGSGPRIISAPSMGDLRGDRGS